ncbi:MAG: SpoIIE family protein phosphatase [Ignavibacteriae bacterium]|nr:SpoIIE family protein phosphatase [Ignavibacteriota bacterium]
MSTAKVLQHIRLRLFFKHYETELPATMDYFPQIRKKTDWIVFALGTAGLVLYCMMKTYWMTPELSVASPKVTEAVTDSLLRESDISRDTISVSMRPNFNSDLTEGITDTLGTFATKQYIDYYKIPYISKVSIIQKKQSNNVNFSIGSGQNASKKSKSSLNYYLTFELSLQGKILAFERKENVDLVDLDQDTAAILASLKRFLPAKYKTESLQWKPEQSENGFSFVTTIATYPHHLELARLTAIMPNPLTPNSWLVGWETDYQSRKTIESTEDRFATFRGVVAVIFVLVLISFIGVFIAQLRKKGVSLVFTIIASVCITMYFVSVSLSFSGGLSITSILLISISTFIFVGFLLGGMPLGGVVSLALEQFPEKFYTLRRLIDSPWKSYFAGRNILIGMAITFISSCAFPLIYWMFSQIHADKSLQTMVFNGNFFSLLHSPFIIVSVALLFTPLINLAIGLLSPAISYRFFSRKWKIVGIITGNVIFFMMFYGLQDSPSLPVLLQSLAVSATYIAVFFFADVLAMGVVGVLNGIIFFLPLAGGFPELQYVFYSIVVIMFGLGIIAYLRSPEKVHEEDYKPQYLYRLEEEKRLRDELTAAQLVQRRLLPAKMPTYPMLDVAATCIPAFEVGGDYYDFFPLDDTHLGILIGDVSGKGMSAAFYITLAKGVIVSQIQQSLSPADILCKVNKLLYETMERGKFISLIYGVLNTATMEFTYSQAGHNPILIRRSNGTTEPLEGKGLALGLNNGQVFNQVTANYSVRLEAGDALILYTDGVTEAVNLSGEEFDMQGLLTSVKRPEADALSLLQGIITDVQKFIGKAKQHDDITIVVIKNNHRVRAQGQLG